MKTRPLTRLVVTALLLYLLLMALAATGFYPPLFRAVANTVFDSMGSQRIARFERFDDPRGIHDTRVSIGSEAPGYPAYATSRPANTVRQGYVPTALVVALTLATPLAWKRRLKALGVGLAAVHLFVGLRVWVALLHGFTRVGMGDRHLLEVSPAVAWVLKRADQLLVRDLHLTYLAPLLIWMVIALRPRELAALWRGQDLPAPDPAATARPGRNSPCPCGSGAKFKHCCGRSR